mmetsp:Transcript_5569/g.6244  ORF Transcript_5569/g.6244 Transcript_5569/m.6244 type:complete len:251 (-) Transcript_5569:559-1311(-)
MNRSISNNTKSWLNFNAKKPKTLSITDFTSRISELASYFSHMPRPRDTTLVTARIHSSDENEQIVILENACPASWRENLIKSNQSNLNLQGYIDYYTALKNLEPAKSTSNSNNFNSNRINRNKKGNKYRQGDCHIHGKNCGHTSDECQVIRRQHNELNSRRPGNNRNNNRNNRNNNYRQNYNNSNYNSNNNRNNNRNNNNYRGNNNQYNRNNNNNGNYNNNNGNYNRLGLRRRYSDPYDLYQDPHIRFEC